jgi:hypothetical protein
LAAVANRKIDAFVQNEKILQYLVKTEFPGQLQTVGGTFDEYFVSVALDRNSPLRKSINQSLVKFMKTDAWTELLNRYRKIILNWGTGAKKNGVSYFSGPDPYLPGRGDHSERREPHRHRADPDQAARSPKDRDPARR